MDNFLFDPKEMFEKPGQQNEDFTGEGFFLYLLSFSVNKGERLSNQKRPGKLGLFSSTSWCKNTSNSDWLFSNCTIVKHFFKVKSTKEEQRVNTEEHAHPQNIYTRLFSQDEAENINNMEHYRTL